MDIYREMLSIYDNLRTYYIMYDVWKSNIKSLHKCLLKFTVSRHHISVRHVASHICLSSSVIIFCFIFISML